MMFLQPLLAGLSVGAFCLTYCFPFLGSFLAAEERSFRANAASVIQLIIGRLIGYLLFGLLFGFLGEKLDFVWLRSAMSISLIVLSVILLCYLLGVIQNKGLFCLTGPFFKTQSPFLLGFFMGINLCPPFLLSITYIFSQHSMFYGIIYFALFFLSSSVYFLPLIFIGFLARVQEFKRMARISGFAVSVIFFVYGIYSLLHN